MQLVTMDSMFVVMYRYVGHKYRPMRWFIMSNAFYCPFIVVPRTVVQYFSFVAYTRAV